MKATLLKQYLLFIPLLMLNVSIFAQMKISSDAMKRTVITGILPSQFKGSLTMEVVGSKEYKKDLPSLKGKTISLMLTSGLGDFRSLGDEYTYTMLDDSTFKFEFLINHPKSVYIMHKHDKGFLSASSYGMKWDPFFLGPQWGQMGTSWFVEPGDSLHVKMKNNIPSWSGRGSEKFKCIQSVFTKLDKVAAESPDMFYVAGGKFLNGQEINAVKSDFMQKVINDEIQMHARSLSEVALATIKANFYSFYLNWVVNEFSDVDFKDPLIKKSFEKRMTRYFETVINPSKFNFVYGNVRISSFILPRIAWMKYCIDNNLTYLDYRPITGKGPERTAPLFKLYDAILKYIPEGVLKERSLSIMLTTRLSRENTEGLSINDLDALLLKYQSRLQSNIYPYSKLVMKDFLLFQNNLLTGVEAYSFSLPDTSGKIVRLKDFEGKVLVVDFMYRNCPGCVQLTPFLAKIEERFKDNNNVAFIAISTDKDKKEWKLGIGKSSIAAAIQLNASGSGTLQHPIIEYYGITSFPTLMVIDKRGRILAGRAPDPRIDQGAQLIRIIDKELKSKK